jgi:hypothetical protein
MAPESDIQQVTESEDSERIEDRGDRTPDDSVDFDRYFDGRAVNPWSKGPTELVRLYFHDDEQGDSYVPVNPAENIKEGVRSSPIGRPMPDDNDDQSLYAATATKKWIAEKPSFSVAGWRSARPRGARRLQ